MSIEPAPDKLDPPYICPFACKPLRNINAVKYHVRAHHKDLGPRERSQLKELILYGKLKYGHDYEHSADDLSI